MQTTLENVPEFSWRLLSYRMAQVLLLYGVILLPTGVGHMNDVLISAVVFSLLSGQVFKHWAEIQQLKTTSWTLLFSLVLFLGVFYSHGSSQYAWQGFAKYEKILFFLAFYPLLIEKDFREFALNAFIVSALISIVIIMMGVVEPEPLINAIDSAFIVSVTSFLLLRKAITEKSKRWLYGALFIFVAAYLLFYNVERTGYLLFMGGVITAFWQRYRWQGLAFGLGVMAVLALGLYAMSPTFQHRIDEGVQEAQLYTSNDAKMSQVVGKRLGLISEVYKLPEVDAVFMQTFPSLKDAYFREFSLMHEKQWFLHPHADIRLSSIGLRLGFMQYSWREIIKHPIFGNGTGSFYDLYWAGGGPTIGDTHLGHPHNEYILILFQLGTVGLVIFIFWQIAMWRDASKLPRLEQYFLQGLLVCFALLGLCNASLFVNPSGVVFVILCSLFLASKNDQRGALWKSR